MKRRFLSEIPSISSKREAKINHKYSFARSYESFLHLLWRTGATKRYNEEIRQMQPLTKKHWPLVTQPCLSQGRCGSSPNAARMPGSWGVATMHPHHLGTNRNPEAGPRGLEGKTSGIYLSQNPKAEATLHPNSTREEAWRPQPTPTTFLWVEGEEWGEGQFVLTHTYFHLNLYSQHRLRHSFLE